MLVYDGDCDFCIYWINRWRHTTHDRIVYAPFQEVSHQFAEIPISEFQTSVQYILEDGSVFTGAEAILLALNNQFLIWLYYKLPGFAPIMEAVYRAVAQHRSFFSKITRRFFKSHTN